LLSVAIFLLQFGRGAAGVLHLDARLATAAGHDVRE
jgi:hypothetical protein